MFTPHDLGVRVKKKLYSAAGHLITEAQQPIKYIMNHRFLRDLTFSRPQVFLKTGMGWSCDSCCTSKIKASTWMLSIHVSVELLAVILSCSNFQSLSGEHLSGFCFPTNVSAETHSPWGSFGGGNTTPEGVVQVPWKQSSVSKLAMTDVFTESWEWKVIQSNIKWLTFTFSSKLSCDCAT